MIKIVENIEETKQFAKEFSKKLKIGDCLILNGEIGAGKTTFTRYLLENFGVFNKVCSPTFTIMNEYDGRDFPFYHFDMYRIQSTEEIEELGFEDYLLNTNSTVKRGICIVEWAENTKNLIPKNHYTINITKLGETKRKFEVIKE